MIEMFTYKSFSARDEMVTSAVTQIAEAVKTAVAQRGTASLMLSGGSSPRPVYERLSEMDLPWDKVTIGLVDDRWIERGQAGSNETFLDETLLKGKAQSAKFIGLKTKDANPAAGIEASEAQLSAIPQPFDVCVMGMGLDGHTASWFPNSKMIPGAGKADVFKASADKSVYDAPVKALRAAGERLTVITDET